MSPCQMKFLMKSLSEMAGQDKKGSSNAPMVTKDKLDLNLLPPYFLTPISNNER